VSLFAHDVVALLMAMRAHSFSAAAFQAAAEQLAVALHAPAAFSKSGVPSDARLSGPEAGLNGVRLAVVPPRGAAMLFRCLPIVAELCKRWTWIARVAAKSNKQRRTLAS
jgi:hypothetical protein